MWELFRTFGMVLVDLVAARCLHRQPLRIANIRQIYGLTVLEIRRGTHSEHPPAADHRILLDDELLVVGSMADAERLSDESDWEYEDPTAALHGPDSWLRYRVRTHVLLR